MTTQAAWTGPIHHACGEWGDAQYPVVSGHEIVGMVAEVGSEVTRLPSVTRCVGCMVDSCGECASCRKGEEQYCLEGSTLLYGSIGKDGRLTQGGFRPTSS